ncbi:MAG: hypothetical protein GY703_24605 [Gammaproteobacteria bacterium]|nr:hypothetical protein [Gammaproteobacteria bacterium]
MNKMDHIRLRRLCGLFRLLAAVVAVSVCSCAHKKIEIEFGSEGFRGGVYGDSTYSIMFWAEKGTGRPPSKGPMLVYPEEMHVTFARNNEEGKFIIGSSERPEVVDDIDGVNSVYLSTNTGVILLCSDCTWDDDIINDKGVQREFWEDVIVPAINDKLHNVNGLTTDK